MRSARLSAGDRLAVVLVAHGSRDPRAGAATSALTRAVRRAHPGWAVRDAYLDHAGPRPADVLASIACRRAVVVPLLLTEAYHGRVDIPAAVASAAHLPLTVVLADVLGPLPVDRRPMRPGAPSARWPGHAPAAAASVAPLLLDGLQRRLPADGLDGVVLAAAGTRDARARATVEEVAAALSERLSRPCVVSYASAAPPNAGDAVRSLRDAGAGRVGVAAYFLAPGLLYDNAVRSAREAGAVAIAEPLGDAPELVSLVGTRVRAAVSRGLASVA